MPSLWPVCVRVVSTASFSASLSIWLVEGKQVPAVRGIGVKGIQGPDVSPRKRQSREAWRSEIYRGGYRASTLPVIKWERLSLACLLMNLRRIETSVGFALALVAIVLNCRKEIH